MTPRLPVAVVMVAALLLAPSRADDRCGAQVDMTLVVDSSGSIKDSNPKDGSYDNWSLMKEFMVDFVSHLDVGLEAARVAMVTFSNKASVNFYLDTHTTQADLIAAINSVEYLGGNTNTSGGLWITRDRVFTSLRGDRPAVPNVVVLITDGVATYDSLKTIPSANSLKEHEVKIYVVGVTRSDWVVKAITNIASAPQTINDTIFITENFKHLTAMAPVIEDHICDVYTPTADKHEDIDLVFVLDSSGSIRDNNPSDGSHDNWRLLLQFVISVLRQLNIGTTRTRVGVTVFSDSGENVFYLEDYHHTADMVAAVENIRYIGSNTNTSGGLWAMRTQQFTAARGDRPGIQNVAVVLTDGASTRDVHRTVPEAKLAADSGILVLPVGVSAKINETEIKAMSAGSVKGRDYWKISDFAQLKSIVDQVVEALPMKPFFATTTPGPVITQTSTVQTNKPTTLQTSTSTQATTSSRITPTPECTEHYVDIVFLLDASASIRDTNQAGREDNWDSVKRFVVKMVQTLDIGTAVIDGVRREKSRVGVIVYSDYAESAFYLDSYPDKASIIQAVNDLSYHGYEATNTYTAVRELMRSHFLPHQGEYDNRRIALFITDCGDREEDKAELYRLAALAMNDRIFLMAIDVHPTHTRSDMMESMTSPPKAVGETYWMSPSFLKIHDYASEVIRKICSPAPVTSTLSIAVTTQAPTPCAKAVLDLVFVLDSSGSIRDNNPADNSYDNWDLTLQFVVSIVESLQIGEDQARVGLVMYSEEALNMIYLNDNFDKQTLVKEILRLPYMGSYTNTAAGLYEMHKKQFTAQNGDRASVPNYALVITDGVSNLDKDNTIPEAKRARDAGITVFSLGITDAVSENEIILMSSEPQKEGQNYWMSKGFQDLKDVKESLISKTCVTATAAIDTTTIAITQTKQSSTSSTTITTIPTTTTTRTSTTTLTSAATTTTKKTTKTSTNEPVTVTGSVGATGHTGHQGATGHTGVSGPAGRPGASGAPGRPGLQGPPGQTGLPGRPGESGATGARGATGESGATGRPGSAGRDGRDGETGSTGPRGLTGTSIIGRPGAPGLPGVTGLVGASGRDGATGPIGGTGARGPTGVRGETGSTGLAGRTGATGQEGARGTDGLQGSTGFPGVSGRPGRHGQTGSTGAPGRSGLTGATGYPGETGSTGASGSPGHDGRTGAPGVTGTRGAPGPRGSTGLNGNEGETGATGISGETGSTGAPGAPGVDGTPGISGSPGRPGAEGVTGASGARGGRGETGATGVQGRPGAEGRTGARGEQGRPGADGVTGSTGSSGETGATGARGQAGRTGAAGTTGAVGEPGKQGETGSTGISGAPGIRGLAGRPGRPGLAGRTGATGLPGLAGPTGASLVGETGATGPMGAPGAAGVPGRGVTGARGETGATGPAGRDGLPGARGSPGDKGRPGVPGATGAKGARGITGADGTAGRDGLTGSTGSRGEQGAKGEMGIPGLPGRTGSTGAAGSRGPAGLAGSDGKDGITGATGHTGLSHVGATGATGEPGRTGAVGRRGEDGAPGRTGAAGTDGVTGARGAAGQDGRDGLPGARGAPGSTGATGTSGKDGRTGLPGTTGQPGRPGNPGSQGTPGREGRTGATGRQGADGVTGATGARGLDGRPGLAGARGESGATGRQGPTGITGATGPAGKQGESGATGNQGIPGRAGVTGSTGPAGLPGLTGSTGSAGLDGRPGAPGAPGREGLTGARGRAGAAGETGAAGRAGKPGETGSTGASGPRGSPGVPGSDGRPGQPGETGPAGKPGITGATGRDGRPGETGPVGTPGRTGARGSTGATGSRGLRGARGSDGLTGATGVAGRPGITGATGTGGRPGRDGAAGAVGRDGVTGARGETGPRGVGITGATGSPGPRGADGRPGRDGRTGVPGRNGSPGAMGRRGDTGATGATGRQGVGLTGATGSRGRDGVTGARGVAGAVGPAGTDGRTGATGARGPAGESCTANECAVSNGGCEQLCVDSYDSYFCSCRPGFSLTPSSKILNCPGASVGCREAILDLVFVVDSSGSIRDQNPADRSHDNWRLLLDFMVSIVESLPIGSLKTRVGLVRYSNRGESMFFLDTYTNADQVKSAILALPYVGANTNTSGGLREMTFEQFIPQHGDRQDVQNVAVVITDGLSTWDNARTVSDAEEARQRGVQVFSVGVTAGADETELRKMSSLPQTRGQNWFTAADFKSLDSIASSLVEQTCSSLVSENLFCEHWPQLGGNICFCKYGECDVRPTNATTCQDVNECAVRNGGCQQSCTNTEGSYRCSCGEGYALNQNGHSCDDVDECAASSSPCAAGELCTNTYGAHYCLNVNGVAGLTDTMASVSSSPTVTTTTLLLAAVISALIAVIASVGILQLIRCRTRQASDKEAKVMPRGIVNFGFNANMQLSAESSSCEDSLSELNVHI